jgi:thiamine-phosphate pyrophosphorylase
MLEFDLCVIAQRVARLGRSHLEVATAALRGGARLIQLREKDLSDRALWELAGRMRGLTHQHGGMLIVNDRVDIALAVGADGVHLGEEDLPVASARRIMGAEAIIGASVSNPEEARAAEAAGASYASLGSIFPTTSKPDAGEPVGIAAIGEIGNAVSLPVLAIGGINCDNVEAVIRAGAAGVAVVSAIAEAEDMMAATATLRRLIRAARQGSSGLGAVP